MKLFVVISGCYSNQGIAGVYASVEAAIADNSPPEVPADRRPSAGNASRPGGWQYERGYWDNGLDWDASRMIEEFDLVDVDTLDPDAVVKAIATVQAEQRRASLHPAS